MKIKYTFKHLVLLFTLLAFSCGGDSDGGDDGGGGNQLTSITLSTSSPASIFIGDQVTFSILGNNGQLLNTLADLQVNGTSISGHTYMSTSAGVFEFVATHSNVSSNPIQITVLEPPVRFAKNVLIEDYTGTWCGYCPRVSYGIEQVEVATDRAVPVAIHRYSTNTSSSGYDPYTFDANSLESQINLQGYPTAMLDRDTEWTYPEPNNVNQVVDLANTPANVGLALTPTLSGNDISIEVEIKFGDVPSSNAKLVVYILEDGLIYDQTNYTSYYGGTSSISNFQHDHVLRACLTDLLGDTLPAAQVVEDNVYTQTISVSVPSNVTNMSNMSIVAFVANGTSNEVYNARAAKFGDTQSIEEL